MDTLVPVHEALKEPLFPCVLISLEPQSIDGLAESYRPGFAPGDKILTREQLETALAIYADDQLQGLVIRTRPNALTKKTMIYKEKNAPPYFSNDAMHYLTERRLQHLLVDFPSVDKMYDRGMLSNHRIFWQLEASQHQLNDDAQRHRTITEMIYVDDAITDGFYACQLQVPEIETDAVPSRPLLHPLEREEEQSSTSRQRGAR